jgi:hypothetical protein
MADQPHKDNWQTVAKVRAQTEAADTASDAQSPADRVARTIAGLADSHHDF